MCSNACRIKYSNSTRNAHKYKWAQANKEKVAQSKLRWLVNNPEQRKISSANYIKNNLEYYIQYRSLRSRKQLCAQPKWADQNKLKEIYKRARLLGLEVDHIIPLKHPLVCGLHVPNNLQLLTRTQNARKSNKFDDDILCSYS
jgi:5-methylcytosine-specific restriction endonuclease McrA